MRRQTILAAFVVGVLAANGHLLAADGDDQLKPDQVPSKAEAKKQRFRATVPRDPAYELTLRFAVSGGEKLWYCSDLPGTESSLWYRPEAGWGSLERRAKPCDASKLFEEAPIVREVDLKPYRAVAGWDDWLCADYKDGRAWSAWHQRSNPASSATSYAGSCDAWADGANGSHSR